MQKDGLLYKIIGSTITVKSGDIIKLNGGELKFYFSDHMLGALMILGKYGNSRFLYTGDFHYYDFYPITGVEKIIDDLPKDIDFVLIDSVLSKMTNKNPEEVLNELKSQLTKLAENQRNVLFPQIQQALLLLCLFQSTTIFKIFKK
ncbi:MAG: hypothetical protein ACTSP3_00275 [Candidatus Heimdallarchaeaceae archaeon]